MDWIYIDADVDIRVVAEGANTNAFRILECAQEFCIPDQVEIQMANGTENLPLPVMAVLSLPVLKDYLATTIEPVVIVPGTWPMSAVCLLF